MVALRWGHRVTKIRFVNADWAKKKKKSKCRLSWALTPVIVQSHEITEIHHAHWLCNIWHIMLVGLGICMQCHISLHSNYTNRKTYTRQIGKKNVWVNKKHSGCVSCVVELVELCIIEAHMKSTWATLWALATCQYGHSENNHSEITIKSRIKNIKGLGMLAINILDTDKPKRRIEMIIT